MTGRAMVDYEKVVLKSHASASIEAGRDAFDGSTCGS